MAKPKIPENETPEEKDIRERGDKCKKSMMNCECPIEIHLPRAVIPPMDW